MVDYNMLMATKESFLQKIESSSFLSKFSDKTFAQNFYAALCNTEWVDSEQNTFFFSWRGAGALVASIRNRFFESKEDYMDYYCSGIKIDWDDDISPFVEEGFVTQEISECMASIGVVMISGPELYDDEYFKDLDGLC